MTALLGGLLPACVYDDEDTTGGSEQRDGFNISVAISAGNAPTARAYTGNLPDEGGAGAENYIDINDLQIYAFSTDGSNTLLAQIYPNSNHEGIMPPEVTPVGNTYYLKAELPYDTFSKHTEFKLVAVANGGATSSDVNPDWGTLTYSKDYPEGTAWIPKWNESGIPMFGVQEMDLTGYNFKINNEFNPYTLDDINMLRAMAKIEVVNAVEGSVGIITAVSLTSGYHTTGYIAPYNVETMGTTENVMTSNIPQSATQTGGTLSLHKEAAGKFVAYVPEFTLGNSQDRENKIELVIAEKTYFLSLTPYGEDGKPSFADEYGYPWNALLRNHIYRYTITGMNVPAMLAELVVEPWEVVPLNPDYE